MSKRHLNKNLKVNQKLNIDLITKIVKSNKLKKENA